jgi:hypothetical protein
VRHTFVTVSDTGDCPKKCKSRGFLAWTGHVRTPFSPPPIAQRRAAKEQHELERRLSCVVRHTFLTVSDTASDIVQAKALPDGLEETA